MENNNMLEELGIEELEERIEFSAGVPTCCEQCDPETGICYEEP
jgi:hypothetical protein